MFVIVNNTDGSIFGDKSYHIKSYFETERSAKAAATRYEKKFSDTEYGGYNFDKSGHTVTHIDDYVEPQVTLTRVLPGTGKESTYTIGINSVGTCTDPGTETYWSM